MVPIVGLVLASWGAFAVLQERSFRSQVGHQLEREGATAVREFTRGVGDVRAAQATYARLLEHTPGLAIATRRSARARLNGLLGPILRGQAFQEITIYNRRGAEVINVGPPVGDRIDASLFAAALRGRTATQAVVDPAGLLVLASTPVRLRRSTVGALVVARTLSGSDLAALRHEPGAELAVFQDGTLVATSARRREVLRVLRAVGPTGRGAARLRGALGAVDLSPTVRSLGDGGALVAMASRADVRRFSSQRRLVLVGAGVLLLGALAVVSFFLTRTVLRPLDAMAAATAQMVSGDYRVRLAGSRIPELATLAAGVNHLAERVEGQLSELSHQAFHDRLTGLPNRALFVDRLEHALSRARRSRRSVAVLFVDLDNFKVVNDSLGHDSADELLVAVGERLLGELRDEDTVARLGGDEFTVLLENVAGLDDVVAAVARMEAGLALPFEVAARELFATASIGVTISAGDSEPDALLREADLAMYRAKAKGKARFEIFDATMSAELEERLALETDLRHALERGELVLHYQPIVDLDGGEITAVEALVRWAHPARGLVAPLQFIPIAEQTGLIVPIGRWVLTEACAQVVRWQQQTGVALALSVNVSPRQFHHPELVADVGRALEQTGLDARRLKLELTERVVTADVDAVRDAMTELAALGLEIVIDDFGVEYSSLIYLKRFPVQGLKIDRAFVAGMESEPSDAAIVGATIDVARALGLHVTAEGVENEAQVAVLHALGCHHAQGYHFARPLPPESVPGLLSAVAAASAGR